MAQEQQPNHKQDSQEVEQSHEGLSEAVAEQQAKLGEKATEIDNILADMDDILEENAEEFIEAFVQKGGQ